MQHEYGPFNRRASWMTFDDWVRKGRALAAAQARRGSLSKQEAYELQVRPLLLCRPCVCLGTRVSVLGKVRNRF